ncbi:MAG TPA: fumarylacetoacetate hydrolase family protein [Acidimicrobiales bacterium]|nr:fumarylacetoacetate hydrolase family protein [Acidimicrobiales bacterium]
MSLEGGGVGMADGEALVDLSPALVAAGFEPTMLSLIALAGANGFAALRVLASGAPRTPLADARLAAPVPLPGAIVAAPVNYADHMVEMSEVLDIRSLGVFLKARSSVTGPESTVRLPYTDRRFDQEGELAAMIGRVVSDVGEDEALDAVFGYTCLLDVTMRGGEDRSTRKSFPTFTPTGPWVVTADELGDPGALRLTCSVNGVVRQDASTSELVWSVARIISYASSVMTLFPGDIIATGTPAGVGPIVAGDRVEVAIERIGTLGVFVSSAGAVTCPTLGARSGPVPPAAPDPSGATARP